MKWLINFIFKIERLLKMGNILPGTNIDTSKTKILNAYVLTNNGEPTQIVIVTSAGSITYPYTLVLDKALEELLDKKLNSHEGDIHEAIEFHAEYHSMINFLNLLMSKKNKFEM